MWQAATCLRRKPSKSKEAAASFLEALVIERERHISSTRALIDTYRYLRTDSRIQQHELQKDIADLAMKRKQRDTSSSLDPKLRSPCPQKRADLETVVENAAVAAQEMTTLTQLQQKLNNQKIAFASRGTLASCDRCGVDIFARELTACAPATTASSLIMCPKCSKPWFP